MLAAWELRVVRGDYQSLAELTRSQDMHIPLSRATFAQCTRALARVSTKSAVIAAASLFVFISAASATPAYAAATINTTTVITNATSLATPSNTGASYQVSFNVVRASGTGTSNGTVTVSDGSGQTCSGNANFTGTGATSTGSCNLTSTTAGTKTITATYAGNTTYITSTSAGVAHTVNQAPAPDLVAVATNSVGGNAVLSKPFNWVITITNSGNATATFGGFLSTQTILTDNLPTAGATYGTVTSVNGEVRAEQ